MRLIEGPRAKRSAEALSLSKWALSVREGKNIAMQAGYFCEDCEVSIWLTAPQSELRWMRDRIHVVREVAKHSSGGLDIWMSEGLAFLEEHRDHSVMTVTK